MPDSKITALTSISTSTDPANDPLVIVDVSDTSMAATGTTKKVTLNQLLATSPTATLASATITGDLTVRTTGLILNTSGLGVGISPTSFGAGYGTIQVSGATGSGIKMGSPSNGSFIYSDNTWLNILTETNVPHRHFVNNQVQYTVQHPGVFTWYDGAGGTRMTLNSTGLVVKGTIGTSSGDSVIAFGARGVIVGNNGSAIASGSFIDIAVITTGAGYQGFLSVANSNDASANTRTQTTFSVFGRGTSSTITQIATANGSVAGASFTVTTPSNGLIRITNTSGQPTTIAAQFFGATSL